MLSHLYRAFTPYEWLLTNRRGGYALGSAFLANLRKYHGLLIAGKEFGRRYHLLAGFEERVSFPSGLEYFLDTNFYREAIYPEGYRYIKEYFYFPYPTFYYYCPKTEAGLFLKKSLRFHPDKNILLLTYENISSYPFLLSLRPKLTFRNHHDLSSAKAWEFREVDLTPQTSFVAKDQLALFVYANQPSFKEDPIFYYQVYYPLENLRGYPAYEDYFSPFKIEMELSPRTSLELLFSDEPLSSVETIVAEIKARYEGKPFPILSQPYLEETSYEPILKEMVASFLLKEDVCAGYPWFYAWGRDTFIGLPAFFNFPEAKGICYSLFLHYGKLMKGGMIPNVVGDPGETNYHSVDASLWYALRIFQFLERFAQGLDQEEVKKLLFLAEEVIRGYLLPEGHPFYVDLVDGLITIPKDVNLALTWMDVMLDGKPLTPRYEKPIEIQFLWYNLLKFSERWFSPKAKENLSIEKLRAKVEANLGRYYNGELFADTICGGEPIYEVRPNFVIALSLPYVPLSQEALVKAIGIAQQELLTPYGLRSLSPRHAHFKRKYFGTPYQRDLAYHNGTVWVWLIYPYAQLLKKVLPEEEYRSELLRLKNPFLQLLRTGKLASFPELYDGMDPYYPKGAPAQFWSTAAVYLLIKEL